MRTYKVKWKPRKFSFGDKGERDFYLSNFDTKLLIMMKIWHNRMSQVNMAGVCISSANSYTVIASYIGGEK